MNEIITPSPISGFAYNSVYLEITSSLSIFLNVDESKLKLNKVLFSLSIKSRIFAPFSTIKLYDFDGTVLNTLDTTYTGYDDFYAIGDRIFARFYNGSTDKYDMYMISADSIQSVSLSDFSTDWAPNDYIWWDNY